MNDDDLPQRVIVDQHGHYWRDYGDYLSMCPVSEENTPTEVDAVFERPYRRGDAVLAEMGPALTNVLAHKAAPPEYPGLALVPVPDLEALEIAWSLAETIAAGARIDFRPSEPPETGRGWAFDEGDSEPPETERPPNGATFDAMLYEDQIEPPETEDR